jgi:hypothetical protein
MLFVELVERGSLWLACRWVSDIWSSDPSNLPNILQSRYIDCFFCVIYIVCICVCERDVDGCIGWLVCAIETLLIVSLRHRIYIDCFCVRVTFQNQYSCMAAFQNQYWLFLIDCFCMRERDVDGCIGWLDHAIGRGMVINREEVGFSESILIVSVCHRIYIDCFCARDLLESIFDCGYFSESLLFISDCHRIFQNQYFLLLLFRIYIDYFWVSQNLY